MEQGVLMALPAMLPPSSEPTLPWAHWARSELRAPSLRKHRLRALLHHLLSILNYVHHHVIRFYLEEPD